MIDSFFKMVEGILYVTMNGMVEAGYNSNSLSAGCSRGDKTLPFIKDPDNLKRTLFVFEKLGPKYKKAVLEKWPKPYDYISQEPIKNLVQKDFTAESFYLKYKYGDDNKMLTPKMVKAYTEAASFLNMLNKCDKAKQFIKKEFKSVTAFYKNVSEIIKADRIKLPASYKHLRKTMEMYGEDNYEYLITDRIGNENGKKVKDDLAKTVFEKLIKAPYVDDFTISRAYNNWAKENGRKTISHATVGNYRRKNEPMLLNDKEGSKAWFDKYGKVIKRRRASCPNACWEHDDNDLDLYFKRTKEKKKKKENKKSTTEVFYYGRYVIAVVIDTFNDYIVGWAIAEVYTKDLIRLAYLDAVYHIHELTGGWYLPHQIRSDRFGLDRKLTNDLAQFYESIANYTPAKAKSARGKYIEQSFGKKWHQVLCHYPNYAGHNIKSKASINNELIETNKRIFPNESEAPFIIAGFIDKMRNLQQVEDGPSRQEVWLEAFNGSEISKENKIDDDHMLYLFGTMHTFHNQIKDNKVQITSRCIEVNINNKYHEFDIADDIYMQVVGKRVHVIYEPYNLSRVLITDGDKIRFTAYKLTEDMKMPSVLIDYQPGDRTRLNNKLAAMTAHVKMFTDKKAKDDNILQLNKIDIEGILQSGLLIKGQKQVAELAYQNNLLGNTGNLIDDALNGM